MEVVAGKTGFTVEMLEPGMHLENDLGIDSIKRVEIIAALQAALPALAGLESHDAGAFQTLEDVIRFAGGEHEPDRPAGADAGPSAEEQAAQLLAIADLLTTGA